ncbi:MAG: hypothetical protein CMP11_09555 [Zetaproteobacteria bacterium]|nr:hypothetical protein [Pseudobdellovibrionaceae bacterium]|tara:strand:- start:29 stop:235 length:207 start_codon:yes stop_codon:yes gene_type:complete
MRYLEVGSGTGAFFAETIKNKLHTKSNFDIVEFKPKLCKILEDKLKNQSNVNIFCGSILDWKPKKSTM